MDFSAVLHQVLELLRRRGRVSYRALKLQFQLDDEDLEALKEEILGLGDGGDHLQRPLMAKRTGGHIQGKHSLQEPRPAPAWRDLLHFYCRCQDLPP